VAQEALAVLVVQAAQEALAALVVQVAPAEPELETVPAVVEQELAPVAEAQAPGHPRAQPGAPERIKSVTGARRRDLVRLLAAEDLVAVVAGTTREPAATEAAIAWEVADIAVVVAEDAAAEE
jgi:H2-forming N5,N10-methylenetetrahydromethanopterin dehydrogenase-like enzyme